MDVLNPKHLRAFVTVAQSGSVIRASQLLHRAQSAVTRSIKELERDLDAMLFERRPQGMLLTEFGRTLLRRVERAMAEMDAARRAFLATCPQSARGGQAPFFSLSMSRQRLLVFAELVEQRHMGAVADSLGVSQPAVSQALREVETSLGVALFCRSPAGMQPTPLSTLLATHIRRALAEIRAAELEIGSLQGAVVGRVTVGTLSLGRTRLLPRAILRLRDRWPDLSISTIEGTFEHLSMRLRSGDIDFILGALRPPEHTIGLARETITHDTLALVVRHSHPLSRKRVLRPADFDAVPWVLPPRGTPTRDLLEAALRARGMPEPRVGVETTDLTITRGLLLESDMLTGISPHLFQPDIETRALTVLPLVLPETRRGIGILQRSASNPSLAARLLIDSLRTIGSL